jgi:hypothetical protein
VDFEKAGDVIQPVSMVMGLATMDPSSAVEQVAFLGEAMMEWCYPGKVTGIAVETTKKGNSLVLARLIELMGENIPDVEKTLEGMKLHFPKEEEGASLSELIMANAIDSEAAIAKMQELEARIAEMTEESELQSQQPQDTNPSDQEDGSLTGEQQDPATGSITTQEMAGTYSGSATLQYVAEGMEADDSIDVTLELDESGTGTAKVFGSGGEAQCAGTNVSFSVTLEEGGTTVVCEFEGTASRKGGQITISGVINCSMMGVTFATYAWTAQ